MRRAPGNRQPRRTRRRTLFCRGQGAGAPRARHGNRHRRSAERNRGMAARSDLVVGRAYRGDQHGNNRARPELLGPQSLLTHVPAPALDRALDDAGFVTGLAPQAGEARVGRGRALFRLEIVEPHADRDRNTFTADNAFAVTQSGNRVEEAARAFGHGRPHARLISVVVQAHGDDRAALRQYAFGQIRRTLRDQAEADAVFTAFLGDPLEDLAHRLAVRILVLGNVAVGLFVHQ